MNKNKHIFRGIMFNLQNDTCDFPSPNSSGLAACGRTYKQARSWAEMLDSKMFFPENRWYPDLPLYRMGK